MDLECNAIEVNIDKRVVFRVLNFSQFSSLSHWNNIYSLTLLSTVSVSKSGSPLNKVPELSTLTGGFGKQEWSGKNRICQSQRTIAGHVCTRFVQG